MSAPRHEPRGGTTAAGPVPPADGEGSGATAAGGRGRRPARGTVAVAASVLLGIVLLLWGSDWAARWGAQSLLARTVQSATGVPDRPTVHLHGTFFLPQVVRGRYDDVEITLHGLTDGPLRIDSVHADLYGVHVPFHDVLVRDVGPVPIDRSAEQAFLTYADLNRYLKATDRPVRLEQAPGGQTELTGTVRILGHSVSASARARLSVDNGALQVSPTQLDTNTALDAASKVLLGRRFSFTVPLDPLPFGQQLTSVQPRGDGVEVTAQGHDVVVRP